MDDGRGIRFLSIQAQDFIEDFNDDSFYDWYEFDSWAFKLRTSLRIETSSLFAFTIVIPEHSSSGLH